MIENDANSRCSGLYRDIDYTSQTCFSKIDQDRQTSDFIHEMIYISFSHVVNCNVYIDTYPVYSNLDRYKPLVFIKMLD